MEKVLKSTYVVLPSAISSNVFRLFRLALLVGSHPTVQKVVQNIIRERRSEGLLALERPLRNLCARERKSNWSVARVLKMANSGHVIT